MLSRQTALLAISGCLLLTSCATPGGTGAGGGLSADSGPPLRIEVTGAVARLCKEVLGYSYPESAIVYRQKGPLRAWTLVTRGRHGLISSRFNITARTITGSKVLASREQRGRQIASSRFLKQFAGLSLLPSGSPSKRVDGITGATISSKAMTDAALLALRLDRMRDDETDAR